MIGELPTAFEIGGKAYCIRSDYRVALIVCQAFNDPDLSDKEKCEVCLRCLYPDILSMPEEHLQEAAEKAYWFMGGGNVTQGKQDFQSFDWEQDEALIFPAVNKVAGFEVRNVAYMHWWTFLGYFYEVGEGVFSTVVSIRYKLKKHKKLENYERDFYRQNKAMIDLEVKLSEAERQAEQEDSDFLKKLTGR